MNIKYVKCINDNFWTEYLYIIVSLSENGVMGLNPMFPYGED
jgi:hypothetical protein